MRKIVLAVAGAVALTGGGVAAVQAPQVRAYLWPDVKAADAPAPAAAGSGVPVTVGTVEAKDMPVVLNGIGSVQAYNMVTIKSRVDGQIVKIQLKEGEEVNAGDPLIQIDSRAFRAALEIAQATKAKDEAQLSSAQADLARSAQLVGPGFRTQQTYDQQKAAVAQLQAAIKGDQAQIEAAQVNLDYTEIRAPISGRLGVRLVDVGNMVRATDNTGLVTIMQTKPIFVSFTTAQENLHKIHEKQAVAPLSVAVYGSDNQTRLAEGKLSVIDNTIDQTTGTVRLKAVFDNQDERLWPGEFVNVRLTLNVRKGVPTVPAPTVQEGPEGKYVYLVKPDNTVSRRAVEVAFVQDGIAVIGKGLGAGDKVVFDGQYRLTEGARIRPAQPQSGAAG
jgi:membrane fusion protein, multidrug efflux system